MQMQGTLLHAAAQGGYDKVLFILMNTYRERGHDAPLNARSLVRRTKS